MIELSGVMAADDDAGQQPLNFDPLGFSSFVFCDIFDDCDCVDARNVVCFGEKFVSFHGHYCSCDSHSHPDAQAHDELMMIL